MTADPAGGVTAPLVVPPGSLVVLIGPAGSGKSTLAEALFPGEATLSSDAFRARIGGGEADQSVTGAAFAALHRALDGRLAAGLTTVVDATNLTREARAALLGHALRAGVPSLALVLDLLPDLVIARNARRDGRVVPERAVRRHLAQMRSVTDAGLRREGFSVVRRFRSPAEVAALRVMPGYAPD